MRQSFMERNYLTFFLNPQLFFGIYCFSLKIILIIYIRVVFKRNISNYKIEKTIFILHLLCRTCRYNHCTGISGLAILQ